MCERSDIAGTIAYLKLAFSNFRPELDGDITSVDVYLDLLGDLPAEALKAAVRAACSELGRAFAPSPAEIRAAAVRLQAKAEGLPSAYDAWAEVLEQARAVGHVRRPQFSHPLVDRAVERMGWAELCLSENQVADRAHFYRVYEALAQETLADASEIPALTEYIEARRQIGTRVKGLLAKMEVK